MKPNSIKVFKKKTNQFYLIKCIQKSFAKKSVSNALLLGLGIFINVNWYLYTPEI
uniref:Uncharacterized protein n=1 Tax=Heterorhabditis bacteriophora TaxID=37862 RepID=A0A1I7WG32_HETBA